MIPAMNNAIRLWSGMKPFSSPEDQQLKEHFTAENPEDGILRLTDVVDPAMYCFPASGPGPHPAVLVCPGGAYSILAWNHEGLDICAMLNTNGFTAFLLKYRCPNRRQAAHADAARAMRLIRKNAEFYNIDPCRTGVIGFSAGAHLSATISAPAEKEPYAAQDEADQLSYRPDFTALIYPAYLIAEADRLTLAPEFHVDSNVPPTFLVQAQDDGILVENSVAWFMALRRAGVPCEMHVWPEGKHGYGLLRTGNPVSNWYVPAVAWFRKMAGIL